MADTTKSLALIGLPCRWRVGQGETINHRGHQLHRIMSLAPFALLAPTPTHTDVSQTSRPRLGHNVG